MISPWKSWVEDGSMFVLCWVQGDSGLVTNLSGRAIYEGFRMYSTIFFLCCNKGAHECHDEQIFLASTWCRSTVILKMDLNRTYTCRRAASRDAFTLGSTPQVAGMVLWWFPPGTREQQLINCYDFIIVRVCVQYIYICLYWYIYIKTHVQWVLLWKTALESGSGFRHSSLSWTLCITRRLTLGLSL